MQHPASGFRLATSTAQGIYGKQVVQWLLKRNCCLSPAQLWRFYASLCVVSLGIAAFFWFMGATLVTPFVGLELVVVGVALVVHARHVGDHEKIVLGDGRLVIELEVAGRVQRVELNAQWVRVEPCVGDGALIEVSGQGCSVVVGRHVRPEMRGALARELRSALRAA